MSQQHIGDIIQKLLRIGISEKDIEEINSILSFGEFEFYDDKALQLRVAPGEYEIFYGNSSNGRDLKVMRVNVL